jgi:hypothetical protein
MVKRRIVKRREIPIVVMGPDDDRSRTIEKLQRENRHLTRVNQSMQDLLKNLSNM